MSPKGVLVFSLVALAGCGGVSVRFPGTKDQASQEGGAGRRPGTAEATKVTTAPKAPATPGKTEEAAVESALRLVQSGTVAYRIGPADLLEITVYQEGDLERKVRVAPDGTITLPLAGSVKVGGLDTAGAENAITEKLRRYLMAPQVSVFIKEYGAKLVYILGEVKHPGSYPLPSETPMSVLEAVTLAGGFTAYAAMDRPRVIRSIDGRHENHFIEISKITKDGDRTKDMLLKPNDVIFIPESFF